jgi:hypothetical protein
LLFQIIAAHIIANFYLRFLLNILLADLHRQKILHGHHVQNGICLAPLNYRPELVNYRDTIDVETKAVDKPFPLPNDLYRKYRI